MKEPVTVRGRVRVRLYEKAGGHLLYEEDGPNLIVTVGKGLLSGLLTGLGTEAVTDMAIGTGSNAAAAGDTGLQTEIVASGGERKAATATQATTSVANDTARYIASYSFTAGFTVREAGLFTASNSLLARRLFGSPIVVISGNVLEVTWDVIF